MVTNNATKLPYKPAAWMVQEEDLQALEDLLHEMQGRVDKCYQDGHVYLMSVYVRLVALVSPEIDRIERRFKRENLAAMRKQEKQLKQEAKTAADDQHTP